ncbi:PREDICTED: BES1/BZR1 homolog protein 3 isoform X2 [Tarenaya hassleriana]|nr:PREDICTED: BES1/BZR1 homolog protein 3 isoform X2 [Tarenaya hassleriana]
MTSGTRTPTWKERENNKRRERRRRAIAAKIFAGLRMYGNYKLPKHCDNNEVLKALCKEAGWTVEEDGTTYRKGCKPVNRMDIIGGSTSASPCSSYQPSPRASYNPSPSSSSFPSPRASHYPSSTNPFGDANSLIPWLKNLSSNSPTKLPFFHGSSISAPVTPPLASPMAGSPTRCQVNIPDSGWLSGMQTPQSGPSSPTFSLVSRNPFFEKEAFKARDCSPMWTPGQSGNCSPAIPAGADQTADVPMADGMAVEFAFGCNPRTTGLVKPWEGERIHEECAPDDLELTLGNSRTR